MKIKELPVDTKVIGLYVIAPNLTIMQVRMVTSEMFGFTPKGYDNSPIHFFELSTEQFLELEVFQDNRS